VRGLRPARPAANPENDTERYFFVCAIVLNLTVLCLTNTIAGVGIDLGMSSLISL